jgi:hypothetical protein
MKLRLALHRHRHYSPKTHPLDHGGSVRRPMGALGGGRQSIKMRGQSNE